MTVRACLHCGADLDPGALFCGSCGRSTASAPAPDREIPDLVEPPRVERVSAPVAPPAAPRQAAPRAEPDAATEFSAPPAEPTAPEPVYETVPGPLAEPLLPVPHIAAPTGGPEPIEAEPIDAEPIDVEATVVTGGRGPRFVLQFSTGESVTVQGDGLIGRAPVREPGEPVDQLVPLADAGRSVSKTHLAFGQDRGRFWISDRYSTNGTVLRPHDSPSRHCEPGRRYLVSRGTRVDIGDQFFVVS